MNPTLNGHSAGPETIESNLAEYWLKFGENSGGVVFGSSDVCWEYSGTPYFNRVVFSRLDGSDTDRRIKQIVRRFQRYRAAITWIVGPTAKPADLGQRLECHGFEKVEEWTGMEMPLESLPPAPRILVDIDVRHVMDNTTRRDWIRVVRSSFGLPLSTCTLLKQQVSVGFESDSSKWINLVAYHRGSPVAAVTVMISGETAGIYLVSTVPRARRNGIGSRLVWLGLNHAKSHGCKTAVLQATENATSVYETLGFRAVCNFDVYRLPPPRSKWKEATATLLRGLKSRLETRRDDRAELVA